MILTMKPKLPRELEPSLPKELEEIIMRCLNKDLAERFADASQLKAALLTTFPHYGESYYSS